MNILITGGCGTIGSIIAEPLSVEHKIICTDLTCAEQKSCREFDVANEYEALLNICTNQEIDIIIHLAWDFAEDFPGFHSEISNKKGAENVLRAATASSVSRVILASSVHANKYAKTDKTLSIADDSYPDTPYGASKLYIEALGKAYAHTKELEVISVRLGGVNLNDEVRYEEDSLYDKVLLYKEDCVNLFKKAVSCSTLQSKYTCFYAVSNNSGRIHNTENIIDWKPVCPK
jgi:uronate dehydrogenase